MTAWYTPSAPGAPLQARPWLSPAAIEYFESLLTPDMNVIEFGAGGSTLWLAERVRTVTSYESNEQWADAVKRQAHTDNIYICWGTAEPGTLYDLFFIDGEPVERRGPWLDFAPQIVKPGGIIVLDNANRPEYVTQRFDLLKRCEPLACISGNENGTLFLVTEFYRLKG